MQWYTIKQIYHRHTSKILKIIQQSCLYKIKISTTYFSEQYNNFYYEFDESLAKVMGGENTLSH